MATETDQREIQLLIDKAALQELVVGYSHYVDRRDFKNLRTLYHADAIEEHGTFRGDIDEFIDWVVTEVSHFEITMHSISNTLFVVDGNKAQGITYVEAFHRTKGPDKKHIMAWGRYLDHFEKRDGVWKFSYRTHALDRCEMRDVDPAWYNQNVTAGIVMGTSTADDISYRVLTMFEKR